ncbi:MAG: DMT family transporter [Sulfobacillus sp.]
MLARRIALIAVTAIWGSTFLIVKEAIAVVPPLWFIALRFGMATIIILPWAWRDKKPIAWKNAIFAGVWLFLAFSLQTMGLENTGPDRAAFLTSLNILFIPMLTAIWYRKPVRRSIWWVSGVVLLGLLLLLSPRGGVNRGDLMVLGTAIALAGQVLATEGLPQHSSLLRFTAVELGITAILSGIPAVFTRLPHFTLGATLGLVYTGAVASAVAMFIQTWAQTRLSAFETGLIFTLEPVFATLIGVTIGHRSLSTVGALGAVIMLSGLIWHEYTATNQQKSQLD